jgi:carbon monoxide dehydrogenase subunit G
MANDFRGTTVIDRSIEEVFAFLADGENDPKFSPRVLEIAKTTDGPPGVGTVYASTVKDAGMKTKRQFKLTAFDAPTRIRWAEISKNLVTATEGGYDLVPEGSGTRVTIYNVLEGHGVGKLLAPLALRSARKGADDFAKAIKAAVEASPRESASAEPPE